MVNFKNIACFLLKCLFYFIYKILVLRPFKLKFTLLNRFFHKNDRKLLLFFILFMCKLERRCLRFHEQNYIFLVNFLILNEYFTLVVVLLSMNLLLIINVLDKNSSFNDS